MYGIISFRGLFVVRLRLLLQVDMLKQGDGLYGEIGGSKVQVDRMFPTNAAIQDVFN